VQEILRSVELLGVFAHVHEKTLLGYREEVPSPDGRAAGRVRCAAAGRAPVVGRSVRAEGRPAAAPGDGAGRRLPQSVIGKVL
jgi:hypothetical protein